MGLHADFYKITDYTLHNLVDCLAVVMTLPGVHHVEANLLCTKLVRLSIVLPLFCSRKLSGVYYPKGCPHVTLTYHNSFNLENYRYKP